MLSHYRKQAQLGKLLLVRETFQCKHMEWTTAWRNREQNLIGLEYRQGSFSVPDQAFIFAVLHSLSAACEEDIQCSEGLGDLGRCTGGQCACSDGAQVSEDTKKCSCVPGEEFNKFSSRCEKTLPSKQQAVQEMKPKEGDRHTP